MDTRRSQYKARKGQSVLERKPFYRQISWGAILGGALLALLLAIFLHLMGNAFGSDEPLSETLLVHYSTGAMAWWVAGMLLAIFAGAFAAGRFSQSRGQPLRLFHGILCWLVFSIAYLWILVSPLGQMIGGVGHALSQSLQGIVPEREQETSLGATHGFEQQAAVDFYDVQREVRQMLSTSKEAENPPQEVKPAAENTSRSNRITMQNRVYVSDEDIRDIMEEALYNNGVLVKRINRQEVEKMVAENTNLGPQEVGGMADIIVRKHVEAKRRIKEAKARAEQEAEQRELTLLSSMSKASRLVFISLFLGAVVGAAGGMAGKGV